MMRASRVANVVPVGTVPRQSPLLPRRSGHGTFLGAAHCLLPYRQEPTMSQSAQHRSNFSGMFGRFASAIATAAGSPVAFSIALISLIAWGASGPFFDY